jgi:hypothetical protein
MKSGPGPASETDVSDCLSGFPRRKSFEKAIYLDLSTNAPFQSPGGAFSRPAPQRLIMTLLGPSSGHRASLLGKPFRRFTLPLPVGFESRGIPGDDFRRRGIHLIRIVDES